MAQMDSSSSFHCKCPFSQLLLPTGGEIKYRRGTTDLTFKFSERLFLLSLFAIALLILTGGQSITGKSGALTSPCIFGGRESRVVARLESICKERGELGRINDSALSLLLLFVFAVHSSFLFGNPP